MEKKLEFRMHATHTKITEILQFGKDDLDFLVHQILTLLRSQSKIVREYTSSGESECPMKTTVVFERSIFWRIHGKSSYINNMRGDKVPERPKAQQL